MSAAIRQVGLKLARANRLAAVVEPGADDDSLSFGRAVRIAEALLFAAAEPLSESEIAAALPPGIPVGAVLGTLADHYAVRGVTLVQVAGKWALRTAPDLAYLLSVEVDEPRRLSRAAIETLAIVAYHQPVTRAEIEDIRGVATSKGTLDVLLETGWVRMRGRRRSPGRPITFGTTDAFLDHFGLAAIGDLPGLDELKAAGMFDGRLPAGFQMPLPSDDPTLKADEDALEPDLFDAAADARIHADEAPLGAEPDSEKFDEEPLDPLDRDPKA
jgi:segregation and condensation protein B